jgi:DNA-directed RNA polymerase I, II, and III subunit RPABC1
MLNRRGYAVTEESVDKCTIIAKHSHTNELLYVFFVNDAKFTVKHMDRLVSRLIELKINHALIIAEKHTIIKKWPQEHVRFEFLTYAQLIIDIMEHVLVPKHEVLSHEEKEAVLKRYSIHAHQLPLMKPNDPVAHYLGLVEGQVVKITRPSDTAGEYISYRIVM